MRYFMHFLGVVLFFAPCAVGDDVSVHVKITPGEKRLLVDYVIAPPITELRLQAPDLPGRSKTWQVLDAPDLILTRGVVKSISGSPFSAFSVAINQDTEISENGGIGLVPVGPDEQVFSLYELVPDSNGTASTVCVEGGPHLCDFTSVKYDFLTPNAKGFIDPVSIRQHVLIYTGDDGIEDRGDVVFIADPRLPDWLRAERLAGVEKLIQFYAKELYFELQEPLVFIMSWNPDIEESSWNSRPYELGSEILSFSGELPAPDQKDTWLRVENLQHYDIAVHYLNDKIREPGVQEYPWFYISLTNALTNATRKAFGVYDGDVAKFRRRKTRACIWGLRQSGVPPRACGAMLHQLAGDMISKQTWQRKSFIDLFRFAFYERDRKVSDGFRRAYVEGLAQYDKDGLLATLMASIHNNSITLIADLTAVEQSLGFLATFRVRQSEDEY